MPMTMTQKILAAHCGRESLAAGDLVRVATALVAARSLAPGDRLLCTRAPDAIEPLLACTVVPALLRSAVVLGSADERAEIVRQEGNATPLGDVY